MAIGRRATGKGQLWWLSEGPGAHGDQPLSPREVEESLAGTFRFVEESPPNLGLRTPQLGALHAILAHYSMEATAPITIVLPTGTGKTETMLAAFCYEPRRTLVVVPSDSLRTQIGEKFATLGVLSAVGAVEGNFLAPVVMALKSGLATAAEAEEAILPANVIVATAAAIAKCSGPALARLVELTDQLFIDEAHHVAAKTWRAIADAFDGKPVVQFTATPFREDGQFLDGRIAYAYPLRLAQKNGYFAKIDYHAVTDLGDTDRAIAEAAIARLRADRAQGLDHLLMARVQTIPRATEILALYEDLAPDLCPVRIDSKQTQTRARAAKGALDARTSQVVVCVDMLGEGFDLPALKIAAVHDPHKSLAVTLQFVGRFTRVGGDDLGDASVFVPRQAVASDERLRRLYGEDSDWNEVIRDLTHAEVEQEQARSDFEAGFGQLPSEIAIRSLEPKMSTVVYLSDTLTWNPDGVYEVFPEDELLTKKIAINEQEHVLWFVTEEQTPVRWGDFATFAEITHNFYLVHCDLDAGRLYINSSNNDAVHESLAKAIGGPGATLVRGDVVYRVLSRINRRVPTNVGLLDAVNRNRRFTMHVGADVLEGFGPGAAQKSKTNIFAHGYSEQARISFGASRKGRIWSFRVAHSVLDWVTWARSVGATVTDETIDLTSVMSGFIIPSAAIERPDLVPLGVEWPHDLIATTSEARQVSSGGSSHPLIDLDLAISTFTTTGPIEFEVSSDDWTLAYEMTFDVDGPKVTAVADDAQISTTRSVSPLSEFMTKVGLTVYFEQEALLSPDCYLIQPNRARPLFPTGDLEAVDWTGINIHKESQGPDRDADSVQHRVWKILGAEADWEVVVDDDGKGEVADLLFLRREDHQLHILLAHCKFSGGDAPGARVGDLYELCGQAAKCHKARSEIEIILRRVLRRERNRQQKGLNGLLVGTAEELHHILDECRLLDPRVTIVVAQPGLSMSAMSHQQSELLACTHLYLSETYGSAFRVLCST